MHSIPLSPKLKQLWKQSYLEEGYEEKDIPNCMEGEKIALYPRSYVENTKALLGAKTMDYNFRGALYIDKITIKNRIWILDFASKNFTDNSLFQITDRKARQRRLYIGGVRHKKLGTFDYTFDKVGFVPKETSVEKRNVFDKEYYQIMCDSKYTLCPAGDAPWSMRFYEAIMSKSIPVLSDDIHSGRNKLEYEIGYKYYLASDSNLEFREDWVEENYKKFIQHQTLTK